MRVRFVRGAGEMRVRFVLGGEICVRFIREEGGVSERAETCARLTARCRPRGPGTCHGGCREASHGVSRGHEITPGRGGGRNNPDGEIFSTTYHVPMRQRSASALSAAPAGPPTGGLTSLR
jgi:hypothetical protein